MSHALEKGSLDDDFFTSDIRVLQRSVEESKADLKNILFVGSKLLGEIDEVKRERGARLARLPIKYTAERTFEMKEIASLEREARMEQLKLVND